MRESGRQPLEAVRDIRLETRLTLTGVDLIATSVAAFVGGWLIGYITTIN
jgi:ActR/RegA family two-component response regulator